LEEKLKEAEILEDILVDGDNLVDELVIQSIRTDITG
jgi:hypothetical protein